jgi:hypothetical protein
LPSSGTIVGRGLGAVCFSSIAAAPGFVVGLCETDLTTRPRVNFQASHAASVEVGSMEEDSLAGASSL